MKTFIEATKAIREVALISNEIGLHDEIYLVHNTNDNEYYVTSNQYDVEDKIYSNWRNRGCTTNPDVEAKNYNIWIYSLAENKERWPDVYEEEKKSLLNGGGLVIRKQAEIQTQQTIDFNIIH